MFKNLMPKLLNRKAKKTNWKEIFNTLGDLDGKVIGDIGSGGGFFTLKFASAVGDKGKVYAIDNSYTNLKFIKSLSRSSEQNNIELIFSDGKTIPLDKNSVDIFFSRNSFHHIASPEIYFSELKPILKDKGKVIIIDYKKTKKINFINVFGHSSAEDKIIFSMKKSGYQHIKSYNISESESYNIFQNI